jgi:hypothetical protein
LRLCFELRTPIAEGLERDPLRFAMLPLIQVAALPRLIDARVAEQVCEKWTLTIGLDAFPVQPKRFPVHAKLFPVLLHREFRCKLLNLRAD